MLDLRTGNVSNSSRLLQGIVLPILRSLAFCIAFSALALYSPAFPAKRKVTLTSHLGLAVQKSGPACLYTHNADLSAGSPLTLVLLSPPQSTIKAEVIGPGSPSGCPSIDNSDATMSAYEIRAFEPGLVPSTPAIAVSGSEVQFQKARDNVSADINQDGHKEYFRFCASREGIHLTVWSGQPLRGKPKWHQYYYLGYDVESNCTAAETQGP